MKNNHSIVAGVAVFALVGMIALPSPSKSARQEPAPQAIPAPPAPQAPEAPEVLLAPDDQDFGPGLASVFVDDGGSWLGVETQEVTVDKAKSLKLPAERGVVIGKVLDDSPAAKSGLKENDVITEINGQRVEGAAQFRRMVREIPAGRSVQLTVWRDGRAQSISATLGKMQEARREFRTGGAPQVFKFRMPEMPEAAPMPGIPSFEWDGAGNVMLGDRPRLGIDAEDISGQLGSYFGAPDGEGILVRDVNSGSAAEKAGLKAGDIITSVNGEKIHGLAELRSKLAAAGDGKTIKLGVLRNKSALSLDVELPAAKTKTARKMEMRTKI